MKLGRLMLIVHELEKIGIMIHIFGCPLGVTEKRQEFSRALLFAKGE